MTRADVRVAVTGLGVRSPAGASPAAAFEAVLAARCLAKQLDSGFEGQPAIACLVSDPAIDGRFDRRELKSLDRTARLGVAAAHDALDDAGLAVGAGSAGADRWAVAVGVGGCATASTAESTTTGVLTEGAGLSAYAVPMMMPSATAARISLRLGIRGQALTYATACASGGTAIGEALRAIRCGVADVVVAGGAESGIAPLVMEAFRRIGALSQRTSEPEQASRPFDALRDGFVMAEGAAFLVLERWEHAARRGARIYAELAGYGTNSDAYHIVSPRPDGVVAARCMALALRDAQLDPADIGHINAHGTSTCLNDEAEARAIARCFGSPGPPVTAPKGVTGHMIGAAGAFEAVITVLSLVNGVIPPVANHLRQAGDVMLDVVAGSPRTARPAPAISNSFGFGGHNATLVFCPV